MKVPVVKLAVGWFFDACAAPITKCELRLRQLLGRSPQRIALSREANLRRPTMQTWILPHAAPLVPFYLSAARLCDSCALKRIVFCQPK
jgi:hypothetical protein